MLIAAPDVMPALKARAAFNGGELLAFADSDALRALDAITKRRPAMVALERAFAATPRGAALINRIKADPALAQSEIRVVSYDTEIARVAGAARDDATITVVAADQTTAAALDAEGTRRVERVAMAKGLQVLIDGNPATLIDLSREGAQVVSPTVLKPNQRIRLTLGDERGTWRVKAVIAWANFEIPPRYRAGLEFHDVNASVIDAYMARHKA